jgi:hypothetical protein
MECEPVDRRPQSLGKERTTTISREPPDAAARWRTSEGKTRLGNVRDTGLVEREAGRERESLRYQFELAAVLRKNLDTSDRRGK